MGSGESRGGKKWESKPPGMLQNLCWGESAAPGHGWRGFGSLPCKTAWEGPPQGITHCWQGVGGGDRAVCVSWKELGVEGFAVHCHHPCCQPPSEGAGFNSSALQPWNPNWLQREGTIQRWCPQEELPWAWLSQSCHSPSSPWSLSKDKLCPFTPCPMSLHPACFGLYPSAPGFGASTQMSFVVVSFLLPSSLSGRTE